MIKITIAESLYFIYRGEKSIDKKIYNVNIESGMQEETFIFNRTIKEIKIRGNDKPYFQEIEQEPLMFTVSFMFHGQYDYDLIRNVARWLSPSYYSELKFSDDLEKIYYAMPVEDLKLIHNCLKEGYIKLTFRCDSPYTYSPIYESQVYDFSTTSSNTIEFINYGDVICKPELWIYKIGNGDISIINNSDGGKEFKFTGLINEETVYIHNEIEYIETDIPLTYRYDNFNNNYLNLVRGKNILQVIGNCKIKFRYQFKRLF